MPRSSPNCSCVTNPHWIESRPSRPVSDDWPEIRENGKPLPAAIGLVSTEGKTKSGRNTVDNEPVVTRKR